MNLVVALLGLLGLSALAGLVFLGATDHLTPTLTTGLFGTVTGTVGAVAGLLGRTDSIDVAGLDQLKAAADESFLPVLETKLSEARAEGVQQGLAAVAPPAGDLDDTFDPGPAAEEPVAGGDLEAIPPPGSG